MNDEIKEILDYVSEYRNDLLKRREYIEDIITNEKFVKLLDYITNLQQENERIEKEWKSKLDDVSMLTSRIYNAIEYINNKLIPYGDEWCWDDGAIRYYVLHLLNILQNGSDS